VARIMPEHPIYIVTKGRWDTLLTHRALTRMEVPHSLIVEEPERDLYAERISAFGSLLVLPPEYKARYDTCDDLGDTKGKGPGAARNFAWDQAQAAGAPWHWVMDDNIRGFWRLNHNLKVRANEPAVLRIMEEFAERYENVAMAGPTYYMFASRKSRLPPFVVNTRIYSCNLIRTDVPYRWRGRYNEDTDLSLRMLKDGWCTIQYNAILQWKMETQVIRGGNTAEFYEREGTLPKSQMQVKLHPDVSRLVWKFGRWHHEVDYRRFARNRLRLRPDVEIPDEPQEYGLHYERRRGEEWHPSDPATEWADGIGGVHG
jgi:TET-Associated Glycosyltransferase